MADLNTEECYAIFVNQAGKVLDSWCVSKGGLTETSVDVRCVLREAVLRRATALALCHNHPSGQLRPSSADDAITRKLKDACTTMGILLIDHIIFTDRGYYSYMDEGRL